jgi:hypothetical protein
MLVGSSEWLIVCRLGMMHWCPAEAGEAHNDMFVHHCHNASGYTGRMHETPPGHEIRTAPASIAHAKSMLTLNRASSMLRDAIEVECNLAMYTVLV